MRAYIYMASRHINISAVGAILFITCTRTLGVSNPKFDGPTSLRFLKRSFGVPPSLAVRVPIHGPWLGTMYLEGRRCSCRSGRDIVCGVIPAGIADDAPLFPRHSFISSVGRPLVDGARPLRRECFSHGVYAWPSSFSASSSLRRMSASVPLHRVTFGTRRSTGICGQIFKRAEAVGHGISLARRARGKRRSRLLRRAGAVDDGEEVIVMPLLAAEALGG